MKTTKRTTANVALDTNGVKIKLLVTLLNDDQRSSLTYAEVRKAVTEKLKSVNTTFTYFDGEVVPGIPREFGTISYRRARAYTEDTIQLSRDEQYFQIGCHIFTLAMFNRILRAAGVLTTKKQTLKAFGAAA